MSILVWKFISISFCLLCFSLCSVTSVTVMIGNSSLSETRGTINGVSQSLVAVLRFVVPTVASLGLAWSELNTDKGVQLTITHRCCV